jgi:hypothetical protein
MSSGETNYERRGFRGATPEMRQRLETIGATFLEGYNVAITHGTPNEPLLAELEKVDLELRGFAYEGAAMGFALLDRLTPWRPNRFGQFLRIKGDVHPYMLHVGVGWVWARIPLGTRRARARLDPVLAWLAYDGWGFHEGFFRWPKYVDGNRWPMQLTGYEKRSFDQGLGRSLWFVNGGNPDLILEMTKKFPADRRGDLWSGIGLAATYAGIVTQETLSTLRNCAGEKWSCLAQGAAFAAEARQRAGNSAEYTEMATRILCGLSTTEAARLCDTTLENLPENGSEPAFEIWRTRIQNQLQQTRAVQKPLRNIVNA